MGLFASVLVLPDRVVWGMGDSYADLIEGVRELHDNAVTPAFVRAEIIPPNRDPRKPFAEWRYRLDQDLLPRWYDADDAERRVRAILPDIVAARVITSGTRKVRAGQVYAYGSALVVAYGLARVSAHDFVSVEARDSSYVNAFDSALVNARDSSRVDACGVSCVDAYDSSRVDASGVSRVYAHDSVRVEACGASRVYARDSSRVDACDSVRVDACDSASVSVYDSASVIAYDSASVIACGGDASVRAYSDRSVSPEFSGRGHVVDMRGDVPVLITAQGKHVGAKGAGCGSASTTRLRAR